MIYDLMTDSDVDFSNLIGIPSNFLIKLEILLEDAHVSVMAVIWRCYEKCNYVQGWC